MSIPPIMALVRALPALPPPVMSALLGVALAACSLPLPWSFLSFLPLALLLWYVSSAASARQVAGRAFWAGFGYSAVHLWWLTAFLVKIFGGIVPLGALAFGLFAIEGGFLAGVAYLMTARVTSTEGRVWALAGGWVILEWLRFLGPLAFPWPTLGYTLLPTPMIQVADLGGVLLGSVLVTATAAALVSFWLGRRAPLSVLSALWVAALAYGVTRQPAAGPVERALLQRTTIDSFSKALGHNPFDVYQRLTTAHLQPGEVVVWTETAATASLLPRTPGAGIYGVSGDFTEGHLNRVVAWDGAQVTSHNEKARPVPFGEYFPLRTALAPVYTLIERATGVALDNLAPASTMTPLSLNGVKYGAYVCYDSVFPWVARHLGRQGAQVLVNVSNDGWYEGWGVQQHFMMGRVRAIENRRWLIRSVNEGIAAVVDDLGRPRQVLDRGEGVLHARYRLLSEPTLYQRLGDWPALLLALLLVGIGVGVDRGRRPIP